MKRKYDVLLFMDHDETRVVTVSGNTLSNLVARLKSASWIQCEDSKHFFNMNKVLHFYIEEANR